MEGEIMRFLNRSLVVVVLAGAATAASGQTQPIATFSYNNMSGNYNAGLFTAFAAVGGATNTSGSVARNVVTTGTAVFMPGFFGGVDPADCQFNISVGNFGLDVNNNPVADGSGGFTLTDFNGDTVTGNITGVRGASNPQDGWGILGSSFIRFNGQLSNVIFHNNSGDDTFNGNSGSFSMNFFGNHGAFPGTITFLRNAPNAATNFFNASFAGMPTGVNAQIVPTPGALALLGLGGLAAARRRR